MGYYVRRLPATSAFEAWRIDTEEAWKLGVPNAEQGPGAHLKAAPGESIWDHFRRTTPWFEPSGQSPFVESQFRPGEYYPRMARPSLDTLGSPRNPGIENEWKLVAIARSQVSVLARQLDRICQTVHPESNNLDAFGHEIRNLLILSCTEVEAHWHGVLKANSFKKDRPTTKDYVHLSPAMRLGEYAVSFPGYPWLEPIQPYRGWGSSGKPTQELKWYESYNAVKHNREAEFQRATLRHVFEAISACVVMLVAEFGPLEGSYSSPEPLSFFHISATPSWQPEELYIPAYEGEWTPVDYSFD